MTFVQEWEAHGPPGSASSALLAASAPMSPLMATAAHGPLRRSRESSGAFTQAAAAASRELHMTSMKISKLTQRAYADHLAQLLVSFKQVHAARTMVSPFPISPTFSCSPPRCL